MTDGERILRNIVADSQRTSIAIFATRWQVSWSIVATETRLDAKLQEGAVWLSLKTDGWTVRQIQIHCAPDLSQRTIRHRIQLAREYFRVGKDGKPQKLPRFLILTPIGLLSPTAPCAHRGPIPHGARVYCVSCHQTGCEHYKALQLDPRETPKLDPKLPEPAKPSLTRKEKRAAANKLRRLSRSSS